MHLATKEPKVIAPILVYNLDGTIQPIFRNSEVNIDEMQTLLGGYLEKFNTDLVYHYFCDEDGHRKKLKTNPKYSPILGKVLAIPRDICH